jgi:hypothetical protein
MVKPYILRRKSPAGRAMTSAPAIVGRGTEQLICRTIGRYEMCREMYETRRRKMRGHEEPSGPRGAFVERASWVIQAWSWDGDTSSDIPICLAGATDKTSWMARSDHRPHRGTIRLRMMSLGGGWKPRGPNTADATASAVTASGIRRGSAHAQARHEREMGYLIWGDLRSTAHAQRKE